MSYENPLRGGPMIVVAAVGQAQGSRAAAAALACARADLDVPTLLVEVGGRPPRPALLASAAAQQLEQRLAVHLPEPGIAARGQVCHLAVASGPDGLEASRAAVAAAREAATVIHVPPDLLQPALAISHLRVSAVLLRADLGEDRALVALAVSDLLRRGLAVSVLKQRLGWVAERRALFGVLPGGAAGGLPEPLVDRLTGARR
jgi:hypothetical protein